MPITPERKNSLLIARDFRSQFTSRTGITDFDTDSKSDALIQVFLDQVIDARNEAIGAFYGNLISNATGEQLDIIGQDMGLPRLAETFAEGHRSDQNLAFYVSSGNFGDLNGAADILVPAGTRIYSDANENELGAEISYLTTQDVTLPASSTVQFFGARCKASGPIGNVGSSVMRNHNFTNYVAGTGLRAINFYSLLNGRAQESDRNYRFRLSRRYDTLSTSNHTRLHLRALRVPGVLDTRIFSGFFGIGTVAVVVLGAENQSNPALVRAVQARMLDLSGPGMDISVTAATAVYFDLEMEVKTLRTLSGGEKRQVEATMKRALRNHFRSAGIASSISLLQAAKEVQSYTQGSVRLVSLGKPAEIFKTVYIRRGPSGGIATERDLLENGSYALDRDEFADLGTFSVTYL